MVCFLLLTFPWLRQTFTYTGLTSALLSYMQKREWLKARSSYLLQHSPPCYSFRTKPLLRRGSRCRFSDNGQLNRKCSSGNVLNGKCSQGSVLHYPLCREQLVVLQSPLARVRSSPKGPASQFQCFGIVEWKKHVLSHRIILSFQVT